MYVFVCVCVQICVPVWPGVSMGDLGACGYVCMTEYLGKVFVKRHTRCGKIPAAQKKQSHSQHQAKEGNFKHIKRVTFQIQKICLIRTTNVTCS